MRSALWETSGGALAALLNAGGPLNKADLYTLTLSDGTVYRWSGSDVALSGNSQTWTLGPGLQRTKVRFVIGTAVDDLRVTITDIRGTTINGIALMAFIAAGGLVGARLQLDRAFWGPTDQAPVGALMWFAGRISVPAGDRYSADLVVQSDTVMFETMVPREVFQARCLNTMYDSACTKDRTALTLSITAGGATDAKKLTFSHAATSALPFALGSITGVTGANAGISRSIRAFTSGSSITVLNPWPFAVAPGDTFSAVPGCDGTQTTCNSTYSNLIHFRGQPYIPLPESIL